MLSKIKYFFTYKKLPTNEENINTFNDNNIDSTKFDILEDTLLESPSASFQLIFKVSKDELNSSLNKARELRLNINSMYLDNYSLHITKEKQFIEIENACPEDIKGYYYIDKKRVSTGVYLNASLLNIKDDTSDNPIIEVYAFERSCFAISPFEYCSTEIPLPTIYDFLPYVKSATTLLNPLEFEEELGYYIYTVDLEGKIYLAPLVEITEDPYTLNQLNKILNKDDTNTMFSRGELASIKILVYEDIPNFTLNLNSFQYLVNLTDLSLNNLSYDTVPDEIFDLEHLSRISIDKNSISDLSLFKYKNIYISANEQTIEKSVSNNGNLDLLYKLNIEFLRDANDKIPTIRNITNGGREETINNERYIVWTSNSLQPATFDFSSSSNLFSFSGTVKVIFS